jgi:tRNA threonylcarbamoyladenosine biosynthesis protein TsaB
MSTLVIENSASEGSVALVSSEGKVEQDAHFSGPRGRGSALFDALATVVSASSAIDRVLVGTGPGSYNGLRAAIAAAWGLGQARGIPVRGVSSLLGYDAPAYCVVGDARAGQWFVAEVADGVFLRSPELIPAGSLDLAAFPSVFSASEIPGTLRRFPQASILARATGSSDSVEPLYLKPPHITQPRQKVG